MKFLFALFPLFVVLGILGSAPPSREPPTTRVETCTDGDCHAETIRHQFLHGPVASAACDVCHDWDDPAQHSFLIKREGSALCDFCHIGKTDTAGLHVHEPVEKGECLSCHDPHGSAHSKQLTAATTREVCLSCHEETFENRPQLHTPIQEGECLGCHSAHSSLYPKLLLNHKQALCLGCHEEKMNEGITPDHPRIEASIPLLGLLPPDPDQEHDALVHEPVALDCGECHEHHGGHEANLLKSPVLELCSSCHEDSLPQILSAEFKHTGALQDRACLNCHDAHRGTTAPLLRDTPIGVCLECHRDSVTRSDQSVIASLAFIEQPGMTLHGPIQEGDCLSCHRGHGGPFRALLEKPFAAHFYQPYEEDAYALCFSCHDAALVQEETTSTATNFRNGDQNLHAMHVNTPDEIGRNCSVCHETHGGRLDRLMRPDVPFGQWKVPILFETTTHGGKCAAGCHRERKYNRVNPESNEFIKETASVE